MLKCNTTLTSLNISGLLQQRYCFMRAKLTVIAVQRTSLARREAVLIAEGVAKNPSLKLLNMRGNGIDGSCGSVVAAALLENKALTSLDLGGTILSALSTRNIPALRDRIAANEMGDTGVCEFMKGLSGNNTLRYLSLNGTAPPPFITFVIALLTVPAVLRKRYPRGWRAGDCKCAAVQQRPQVPVIEKCDCKV